MKKFLSKVFGKKEERKAFIERAPRARLLDSDYIYFVSPVFPGIKIGVLNISVTGVGLDESSLLKWPEVDAGLEGKFHFQNAEVPVELRIVRRRPPVIGCAYVGDAAPLRRAIIDFFSVELDAQKMSEVRVTQFDNMEEGNPRWFYSNEGMELFFVEKNEKIVRFYIVNGKAYLEGSPEGLRSGQIKGDEELAVGEIRHKQSSLIEWQYEVSVTELNIIRRLLKNILLEPKIRSQMEEMLKVK